MKTGLSLVLALALATPIAAQDHGHAAQPYKGLQTQDIKSLSDEDIDDLIVVCFPIFAPGLCLCRALLNE